jgi:hypothetical protein
MVKRHPFVKLTYLYQPKVTNIVNSKKIRVIGHKSLPRQPFHTVRRKDSFDKTGQWQESRRNPVARMSYPHLVRP